MGLFIAAALLTAFVINVVLGSVAGSPPLGNVPEMGLLLGAAIAFVVDILIREARTEAPTDDRN